MKLLVFKKIGWFADEMSARYEADFNENIKVRIFKDYYFNGFRFEFLTSNGYTLDELNGDYLSSFWSKATKKETITRVNEILRDTECFRQINNKAIFVKSKTKN